MKKAFALILAIAMIATMMVMPVMAADATYTVTISNETTGHTYEAYQIFSGDLLDKDGKQILSTIEWGTGVDVWTTDEETGATVLDATKESKLLTALNSKFTKTFKKVDDVVDWLASTEVTSDSTTLDTFAEVVGKYLNTAQKGTSTYVAATDKVAAHYEISGLTAGYYLVKDKDGTQDGKYDAYTKYILRVVKDQTVSPKTGVPSPEKEISDVLTGNYDKYEDFDITDTAYYKLTGTMAANLSAYDTYYYKFNDTLPTGITTDVTIGGVYYGIQQIYIEGHDDNVVHTFYDITDDDTTNDTLPTGIKVTSTKATASAQETLVVEFNDLKGLYTNLLSTHKVIVKYSAFVNRDAVIAAYGKHDGMKNEVTIEYSNNPNGEGHGITLPDEAYAFTFRFNVDKYDADDPKTKLEGAEFVLYYRRIVGEDIVKYYAQVVTEEMIYKTDADGKLLTDANGDYILDENRVSINNKQVEPKNLGNIYGWTTNKSEASILDTDENGFLSVGGLDSGTYFLEETKAPAGYNLMETPVQVDITPTYDSEGKLTVVNYAVDSIVQESDVVGVRNDQGSTLPITGGVGTTLFYIFGGILVAGAAILLITKKRMAA